MANEDLPQLQREDYPNIQFWYRRDWTQATGDRITNLDEASSTPDVRRGKARSANGINVTMLYIEHEDGTIIDGFRAADIRRHARSIWVHLASNGMLFVSWGDADCTSLRLYFSEMKSRFPELRYCDLDWKADMIATDNYPAWKTHWTKKHARSNNAIANESSDETGLKRYGTEDIVTSDSKRPRTTTGKALPSIQPAIIGGTSSDPPPIINIIPGTPHKPSQLPVSYTIRRYYDAHFEAC